MRLRLGQATPHTWLNKSNPVHPVLRTKPFPVENAQLPVIFSKEMGVSLCIHKLSLLSVGLPRSIPQEGCDFAGVGERVDRFGEVDFRACAFEHLDDLVDHADLEH